VITLAKRKKDVRRRQNHFSIRTDSILPRFRAWIIIHKQSPAHPITPRKLKSLELFMQRGVTLSNLASAQKIPGRRRASGDGCSSYNQPRLKRGCGSEQGILSAKHTYCHQERRVCHAIHDFLAI